MTGSATCGILRLMKQMREENGMNKIRILNSWEYYEYYDSENKQIDPRDIKEIMDKDGVAYPVKCRIERVEYGDMGHVCEAKREVLFVKHPFGELALNEKSEFYIK